MYDYTNYNYSAATNVGVFGIIALVLSLSGAFVLFYTFLNKSNEKKFKGFTKWAYDFLLFKKLCLESILKFLYLFSAIFITIISFAFIGTSFMTFIMMLILGNVAVRISYELILMFILIHHNLVEINEKTKK